MAIQDPTSLHALAADAATDIQKLATGLAHAGAAPQAVAQLTQMAEKLNQVVKILGAQPDQGAQAGAPQQPGAAPAQAGPPQPGVPQQAPPSPQQPEATQPAAPPPGPGHPAIHAATHALHAAVLAAAAARQQPQR